MGSCTPTSIATSTARLHPCDDTAHAPTSVPRTPRTATGCESLGIIGDGISALACAHYAARAGLRPVVLAPGAAGGWLADRFRSEQREFDRFHVPIQTSDTALCGLLSDCGLLHRMVWRTTRSGFYLCDETGEVRTSASSLELALRAWLERLRRDGVTSRTLGAQILLRRLRRAPLRHGHLPGGHRRLIDALGASITAGGGRVLSGVRLESIEADARSAQVEWDGGRLRFEALISTLPIPELAKLSSGSLLSALPFTADAPRIDVSVVLLSRRAIELPYLTRPLGGRSDAPTVYHPSALVPERERGLLHPIYVAHRADSTSVAHPGCDSASIDAAVGLLRQLAPRVSERDIVHAEVSRSENSDLTWTLESIERAASRRLRETRVFLCMPSRAHARPASVDTSVMLARETISHLLRVS